MNKITVTGTIFKPLEMNAGGTVGNLTIATRRNFKNKEGKYETDYLRFTVFKRGEGQNIGFIEQYFTKGKAAVITGEIRNSAKGENADGTARYYPDQYLIDTIEFAPSDFTEDGGGAPAPAAKAAAPVAAPVDEEDMPF